MKIKSRVKSQPIEHSKIGKRLEIPSTAHVSINKPGVKVEFFTPTIQMVIGIGNDHVAYLIMDDDAWKALKKGGKENKPHFTSLKQFTKKFL